MKRWYVAHTKAGAERLAEGNLNRQGFVTYLPRAQLRKRATRRKPGQGFIVTVPLFPRYIFVQLDLENAPWQAVNSTYGVGRLIAFGEKPAPVADAVIAEIREREREDGIIPLSDIVSFEPGEKVEITHGAFSDRTGIFKCRSDKERVVVLLNLLGRDLTVAVDPDTVRKVA